MRQHPMRKLTQFQISELLGESYGRAVRVANAVTGFVRTGVWPVDSNVFQDIDFAASTQESYPSAGTTNSVTEFNPRQENKDPNQSRQLLTGRFKKYHLCLKTMEYGQERQRLLQSSPAHLTKCSWKIKFHVEIRSASLPSQKALQNVGRAGFANSANWTKYVI
jgi:hypothetical protein